MTNNFSNDFHKALSQLAETRSDCTITCGKVTFKLHRLILHLHSPFFAKRFSEQWETKSAESGVVQLEGQDPEVLRAMFEFCYRFEYETPASIDEAGPEARFHVKMYQAADYFSVSSLADYAYYRLLDYTKRGAWITHEFSEVAGLLDEMEAVPAVRRIKGLVISSMKEYMNVLACDAEILELLGRRHDWLEDLLKALGAEASALRFELSKR